MKNPNAIAKEAEPFLFEGPTPGQSLTNSPDNPYPWEKAPEITSVKVATEQIFFDLLKEDNLTTVATLMSQKTPVEDIANFLLTTGFQKGKWNPDLMLNLLEPTMYMLMAIAEKAGIDPLQCWVVLLDKHIQSIFTHAKNPNMIEAEPIESRYGDAINYLVLGLALTIDRNKTLHEDLNLIYKSIE